MSAQNLVYPLPNRQATTSVAPVSEIAVLMHMIERVMRDPGLDVARIEKLMEMYERISAQQAKQAYTKAMSAAQAEMEPVARDMFNKQTNSKYASLLALDHAVRPIYTKYGFGLSFDTGKADREAEVRILCDVSHTAGHTQQHHIDIPADGKGAKGGDVMTRTHATISAVTYGRTGLLKMIFNIAVGERADDDGNAASASKTNGCITQEQADSLRDLLEASGAPRAPFLKWAKVARVEDIQAKYFDSCINAIKNFQGKKS